jgi:CheY-like chemotaxis protein
VKYRALVVDDYNPWRHHICSSLAGTARWDVVGEAIDGLEAVQKARELRPDLILLDLSLPKLTGIEATERILEDNPEDDACYNYGIANFHAPISMTWGFFRGTKSFWVGKLAPEQMLVRLKHTLDSSLSLIAENPAAQEEARATIITMAIDAYYDDRS